MFKLRNKIFPDVEKEDAIVQLTSQGDKYYHSHDFYEIFYITSGTIKHNLNNITDELAMGDLLFLSPSDTHCFLREQDNQCTHRDIALTVPLYKKITNFFKYDPIISDRDAKPKIDINTLNKLETMLQMISQTDPADDPALFFAIAELFNIHRNSLSGGGTKHNNKAPQWLIDLKTKLELPEYFCAAPAAIFADLSFYSKEYICRTFRKATGKTLTAYMNQKRLSLASVLIQNTNKSIETICYECGYNNMSYFYRVFKKTFGRTPHDFRKILKK